MAELLAELVARISADATELKKALAESDKDMKAFGDKTEKETKSISQAFQTMGKTFAIAGAAITASMGLMTKSAIDEEINIKRLAATMRNAGTSYDDVKDSLEAVIATTERKTGVSDNEQRDILNRLILVTNDYKKSLDLLPTVLDLAAAGGMNATTSATYLAKAYKELEAGADSVSIRFGAASIQFKNMEDIQKRVKGSAEELKNPLVGISNAISNLNETIGANFIPLVKSATKGIEDISLKAQAWTKANPELSKTLSMITLGAGGVLALTGGIILLMPQITKLIAGFQGLATAIGLAQMSALAFTVSIAGLLVGIGMLTYGIMYIADREKAYNDVKLAGMRLDVEREKYLRGEVNNYKALLSAYIPMIEAYTTLVGLHGKDAEIQRQWIVDAKEGLSLLEKTTKATSTLATTIDPELVKAQEAARASAEKLAHEQDAMIKRFQDLIFQLNYNESASAKYGLTITDVYQAMRQLGYTTEVVYEMFKTFGTETNNTQILLDTLGISAETVAAMLGKLRTETDANTESFKKLQEQSGRSIQSAKEAIQSFMPIGGSMGISPTGNFKATTYDKRGFPISVEYTDKLPAGRAMTGGNLGWIGNTEYSKMASGGIVNQPTLTMIGENAPRVREAVIPETDWGKIGGGSNVVVNFTQPVFFDREDTMNRFVDMIRKGIDRSYRLRFGGAYNG